MIQGIKPVQTQAVSALATNNLAIKPQQKPEAKAPEIGTLLAGLKPKTDQPKKLDLTA